MKKLYLLILLLMAGASTVFAQRFIDLKLASNETPGKSYVGMKNNYRTDTMMLKITNNGPDTVLNSDTVFVYSKFLNKRFYWTLPNGLKPGSSVDTFYYFQLTDEGYTQSQTLTNYNWCDTVYLVVPTGAATASDTSAANDKACHTVNVSIFSASVEDRKNDNNFLSIYPNPASKTISIRCYSGFQLNGTLSMRDIHGKEVYFQKLNEHMAGQREITVNIEGFATGLYLLELVQDNLKLREKIIIK